MKKRKTDCYCPTCGKRFGKSKIYRKYGKTAEAIALELGWPTDQVYRCEKAGLLEGIIKSENSQNLS